MICWTSAYTGKLKIKTSPSMPQYGTGYRKPRYVSHTLLKLGVYDAIANFNIGKMSVILALEYMKIVPGYYTLLGCKRENKQRLFLAGYRNKPSTKKRCKIIRGMKKGKEDQETETEGTLYEPGVFSARFSSFYQVISCLFYIFT